MVVRRGEARGEGKQGHSSGEGGEGAEEGPLVMGSFLTPFFPTFFYFHAADQR